MRIRTVWPYLLTILFLALLVGYAGFGSSASNAIAAEPVAKSATVPQNSEAIAKGEALFQRKCSQCHDLKRATSRSETEKEWAKIVNRMQKKPGSGISNAEGQKILSYLVARHRMTSEGAALFEGKCSKCHGLERVTSRTETRDKWLQIVKKMQKKPGSQISDAEAGKILDYLVTQHRTSPQF